MARSLGLAESGEAPAPADLLARFDTTPATRAMV
jgi:hypothetical protein